LVSGDDNGFSSLHLRQLVRRIAGVRLEASADAFELDADTAVSCLRPHGGGAGAPLGAAYDFNGLIR
jgi:hypothetical protein